LVSIAITREDYAAPGSIAIATVAYFISSISGFESLKRW
jgi:hypothetical protein